MRRAAPGGAVALAVGIALALPTGDLSLAQAPSTLTIYSSLPLQGDSRPQSADVVRGEKLALADAGGHAGGFSIHFLSLDDATAAAGKWDPHQAFRNAQLAANDASTIAYLGEFNSGATAVSLPILNHAGIPQVSPSNTYVGLTRSEGAEPDEPDKYYPSGTRTYARVAPADHIQAAALARYMRLTGVRSVYLLNDKEVYGHGMALLLRRAARREGIKVTGFLGIDARARSYSGVARLVHRSHSQAAFYGGITDNGAARLFNALHREGSRMKLFGPDGVAESFFTRRLTKGAAKRTYITNTALYEGAYNARGRRFVRGFRAKYHHHPEPYAIYGYEAMSLVLDAITRAAPRSNDRQAVVAALFATRDRASVLGRYSIDANGDTTLPLYTGLRVSKAGGLRYDRTIHVEL
ncbi:MAG: branched-chain amino acid transport system substrate-binding protein [Solirubrobacteraceae bacterium]|nr:branched-chain amino acid transport system substrate-binding protein [Solirubrobacteraceae bacterium]